MKITIKTNLPEERTWLVPVNTVDYLDSLEEALYVLWELVPVGRLWKAELVQTGATMFQYVEDTVLVRWTEDMSYEVTFQGAIRLLMNQKRRDKNENLLFPYRRPAFYAECSAVHNRIQLSPHFYRLAGQNLFQP